MPRQDKDTVKERAKFVHHVSIPRQPLLIPCQQPSLTSVLSAPSLPPPRRPAGLLIPRWQAFCPPGPSTSSPAHLGDLLGFSGTVCCSPTRRWQRLRAGPALCIRSLLVSSRRCLCTGQSAACSRQPSPDGLFPASCGSRQTDSGSLLSSIFGLLDKEANDAVILATANMPLLAGTAYVI